MVIIDTSFIIDVFTNALLMAEFGQVWAENVCHDVTSQLWRKSEDERSIRGGGKGDSCNRGTASR